MPVIIHSKNTSGKGYAVAYAATPQKAEKLPKSHPGKFFGTIAFAGR